MINKIVKLIIFVLYFGSISIGLFGISAITPTPEDFIIKGSFTEILFWLELLVFLILWILMIRIAYKRVFKRR